MIRRGFIISSALVLGGLLTACSDSGNNQAGGAGAPGAAAQQAAPVGVVALKKDTFPVTTILPGGPRPIRRPIFVRRSAA